MTAHADGTLDVIKGFGNRVRWETGPNRGGNVARSHLLEFASGEWLQYVDADEHLLPLKIERQLGFLRQHPTCDAVNSPALGQLVGSVNDAGSHSDS